MIQEFKRRHCFLAAISAFWNNSDYAEGFLCVLAVGGEALDECGLRYLLAMRLHTCLLTSLPPLYRMQLLHQGKTHCNILSHHVIVR